MQSTHHDTPTWRELAAEGAALEILALEDRVADLMAERDTYRDMALAALDHVRDLTAARARDRETIRAQRQSIRELREMLHGAVEGIAA